MTVSVDSPRAVANQIAPGDRVDMLVGGGSDGPTTYLLENVRVLAVGAQTAASTSDAAAATAAGDGQSVSSPSRCLAPTHSQIVANADTIYLTLRPLAGAAQADRAVPAAGG